MPRKPDPKRAWRYRGRVVGFIRDGTYYINRTIAGRRVKVSTRCFTLAAANAEYERFELNPAAFIARSGRRALANLQRVSAGTPRTARLRDAHLHRKYKITPSDLAALTMQQGGRCAICGDAPLDALEVDHCHATGRVRGLLCGPCNRGVGQLRDDPALLRRAAEYLAAATGLLGDHAPAQTGTMGPPTTRGTPRFPSISARATDS